MPGDSHMLGVEPGSNLKLYLGQGIQHELDVSDASAAVCSLLLDCLSLPAG